MTGDNKLTFKRLFSRYCRESCDFGRCDPDGCESCPVDLAYKKIFPEVPHIEDLWDCFEDKIAEQFQIMDGDHETLIFRDKAADVDYQLKIAPVSSEITNPESICKIPKAEIIWELIEKALVNQKFSVLSICGDQTVFQSEDDESSVYELRLSQLAG